MAQEKIYILLPVHNRREITRKFIECLRVQTFTNYHLVLIDDGSTDGTANMVLDHIPAATVIRGKGDWWWAGSLQQGLNWVAKQRASSEALVLFINDDVEFAPDYLENAVRVMANRKETLVLSRYRSPDNGSVSESGMRANLQALQFEVATSPGQINCLSTRGLFVHWADVQTIGKFHPWLLPHYWSDYEYTIRAHRKGLKCETHPEISIVPNNETTGIRTEIESDDFSDFLRKYFSKRNIGNPVYVSSFILLTFRRTGDLYNLRHIWRRAITTIIKAFRAAQKTHEQKPL